MTEAKSPLVSIVMLCYNHERFVSEALDGVLSQTYTPLEVVIIDDFSQDSTPDIVSRKLALLPDPSHIRFIRNAKNLGELGACNVGFGASRGDFIVLTADDDVMNTEMVAEMAAVWSNEKVSLVTTNAEFIDEHSRPLGRTSRDPNAAADDSFETLVRDGANACCFGSAMGFDRRVYTTFGVPPTHLGVLDIMYPFYAGLLSGCRFLNKPLLRYRVHGKNSSLSLTEERSGEREKLKTRDRIFYGHIAHAITMMEELDRLSQTQPTRYHELSPSIGPLLTIQAVEMAKKLVRNRIELGRLDHMC